MDNGKKYFNLDKKEKLKMNLKQAWEVKFTIQYNK